MAKTKLVRCEIRYENGRWHYRERIRGEWADSPHNGFQGFPTKAAFVKEVVRRLRVRVAAGEYGFSLRIGRKDGTYADEITVPKSRDPKSKG